MNILYIRNFASKVNLETYNLQEVGFSRALVDYGNNCDIIYYSDSKYEKKVNIYNNSNNNLNIIWMPGIKVLSNAIYLHLLSKKFLKKYDLIITTEYSQIMTYLLTYTYPNKIVLYHGPYKDDGKKILHKLYDMFLLSRVRNKLTKIYVKSTLAKNYLECKKGFSNVKVLGVGIDKYKFSQIDNNSYGNQEKYVNKIIRSLKNKKVLLYIGVLEERRNIIFLMDILFEMLKFDKTIVLLLIGNGKKRDINKYFDYAKKLDIFNNIIHVSGVKQNYLSKIYAASHVFLLPSKYEIFGMVLLESMYFGLPVISSYNGGSETLIKNKYNGFKIIEFNKLEWCKYIKILLYKNEVSNRISLHAKETILQNYLWKNVAHKFLIQLVSN